MKEYLTQAQLLKLSLFDMMIPAKADAEIIQGR